MKSKVMTIANALVKRGISRSAAMIRAWITVKLRTIRTKAAGVSFCIRQALLSRLCRYGAEDINISLVHERTNAYDRSAVMVIAGVRGKGAAQIGYLPRELAAAVAPLLDKGKAVKAFFEKVTGGHEYGLNYGMNIAIAV